MQKHFIAVLFLLAILSFSVFSSDDPINWDWGLPLCNDTTNQWKDLTDTTTSLKLIELMLGIKNASSEQKRQNLITLFHCILRSKAIKVSHITTLFTNRLNLMKNWNTVAKLDRAISQPLFDENRDGTLSESAEVEFISSFRELMRADKLFAQTAIFEILKINLNEIKDLAAKAIPRTMIDAHNRLFIKTAPTLPAIGKLWQEITLITEEILKILFPEESNESMSIQPETK